MTEPGFSASEILFFAKLGPVRGECGISPADSIAVRYHRAVWPRRHHVVTIKVPSIAARDSPYNSRHFLTAAE
jgi:hypothetical protein